MALNKHVEGIVRSKIQEQISRFKLMNADLAAITDGIAVAMEEFATAYKTTPEDVILAATYALKDRTAAREAAAIEAAKKPATPKAADVILGLFGKRK